MLISSIIESKAPQNTLELLLSPSDESVKMAALTYSLPPASARHAEAILRAWICGDLPRLRQELESSRQCGRYGLTPGCPDERLELLSAVAAKMMACEDLSPSSESNPQIRLCVSLLAHLAAKTTPEN